MTDPSLAVHSVVRCTTPVKCKSEIFQRSLMSAVLSSLTVGITAASLLSNCFFTDFTETVLNCLR